MRVAHGIDGIEFIHQGAAGDAGERSRQFHARRPAPDYDEIQLHLASAAGGAAFGQFEREQYSPPDFERVFDRLQARRQRFPFVVAEIGVACACGHDQVVVREVRDRQALLRVDQDRSLALLRVQPRRCEGQRKIQRMGDGNFSGR